MEARGFTQSQETQDLIYLFELLPQVMPKAGPISRL